jgi:hypothetical protein
MTCRYPGCTNEVAAPGLSRCETHAFRWAPGKPVERSLGGPVARIPEWRKRSLAKDFSGSAA